MRPGRANRLSVLTSRRSVPKPSTSTTVPPMPSTSTVVIATWTLYSAASSVIGKARQTAPWLDPIPALLTHSPLTSRTGLYLRRQELYVMNLIRISTVSMSFTRRLRPWSLQVQLISLQLLPHQGVLLIGRFKLWAYRNLQPYGGHGSFSKLRQFRLPYFASVYSAANEYKHCLEGTCDGLVSRPGESV